MKIQLLSILMTLQTMAAGDSFSFLNRTYTLASFNQ